MQLIDSWKQAPSMTSVQADIAITCFLEANCCGRRQIFPCGAGSIYEVRGFSSACFQHTILAAIPLISNRLQ